MAVREKCIAEKECLLFDVERRTDDPTVYLLVETWSDPVHYKRDSSTATIIRLTSLK